MRYQIVSDWSSTAPRASPDLPLMNAYDSFRLKGRLCSSAKQIEISILKQNTVGSFVILFFLVIVLLLLFLVLFLILTVVVTLSTLLTRCSR